MVEPVQSEPLIQGVSGNLMLWCRLGIPWVSRRLRSNRLIQKRFCESLWQKPRRSSSHVAMNGFVPEPWGVPDLPASTHERNICTRLLHTTATRPLSAAFEIDAILHHQDACEHKRRAKRLTRWTERTN